MKKIYLFLLSALALTTTTSCEDFLDVRPKGEKVENDQFETASGYEDAIYGVYGYIGDQSLYGMDMLWAVPEVLAQNFKGSSTEMGDLAKYKYEDNSALESRFSKIWTRAYTAIGYANNILQNLDGKSTAELPLYNLYRGEMLGVRAMLHFDLLRFFAPTDQSKRGIPYVKTFNFSVKPFSTVGECLNFIIADLTEAESLIAGEEVIVYPRNNEQYENFNNWRETHMNVYAIKALLARVYWYKGDMAKAAEYAEAVINSNRFPLVEPTQVQDHIAGVLSNEETIFGIYSQEYLSFCSDYLYNYTSFKSYCVYANISDKESYPQAWSEVYNKDVSSTSQDFRKNYFRNANSIVKCLKLVDYPTIENNNVSTRPELIPGISLINVSEMYLIAADALLESNYSKALSYFNAETTSRGLTPLTTETLTADRIYNEYHKEMFGEGQHWFNMKRLNKDIISNAESRTIPANESIYVLPIPQEEFEYRPEDNK